MAYTLDELIQALRDQVVDAVDGIKRAPDHPPESPHEFPFLVCYASGPALINTYPDRIEGSWPVVVELHVARNDLPAALERVNAYAVSIPKAIWEDPTLSNKVNNLGAGQPLSGELVNVQWGEGRSATTTLAWRWTVPLKYEEAFS